MEQTLLIIKPDAVRKKLVGKIICRYERADFIIRAMKVIRLSENEAREFYNIHREKPFYNDLVSFMTSGPCIPMIIETSDAVTRNRELMGATNFKEAAEGTIRREFATSIQENCVHGSDSIENAKKEIAFFFRESDLF